MLRINRRKLFKGVSASLLSGGWIHGTVTTGGIPAPTFLQSIVGPVPSQFNMTPWGSLWKNTNFADPRFELTDASVAAAGITDPAGTSTANKLVEDSANSEHFITTSLNDSSIRIEMQTVTTIEYTVAVIAKAAERSRIVITWQHNIPATTRDTNTFASAGFDLAGGQTNYSNTSSTNITCSGSSIQLLGNGWYLCKMRWISNLTYPPSIGGIYCARINIDNGSGTAADSVSYTGNGTSGVYLWWLNTLPTVAWNISTVAFADDFNSLSTIDLNNTMAPGFNWYTNYEWPNQASTGVPAPWRAGTPAGPAAASTFSISSPSVLQVKNLSNNQTGFDSTLWSAAPVLPGGSTYTGHVFQPTMIWDAYLSFDGLFADYNFANWNGWISMWSTGIEVLTNNAVTEYVELDAFEGLQASVDNTNGSSTLHHLSNIKSADQTVHSYGIDWRKAFLLGDFHRISIMWLSRAFTGTDFGLLLSFFDGTFVRLADWAYSSTAIPQHGAKGGAASVGDLVLGESQHYQIMLSTSDNVSANPGPGLTAYWDWIRVYTA